MDLLEKQVLETLRLGNESAFEMIFKTYYQPLCRYAYSFLQDKEEAEEVVQSSFITVWDKRNDLTIETSVKAYLYRMVRNSCLNVIKHEKVKQQHVAHELAVSEVSHESVSQKVHATELEAKISEAMKTLPEQCRLVFQLSRFEELKYQEIADQLQISVKTVENHMGKALKLMRIQLRDYLPLFLIFMKDWLV
ncbi:MAG: RNA polymerase sigma-70 factor [Cyclobacteriaceae bacterium]|nr:RNA polymerase sigma-70 factor [Cyclobacteriaceae bacterium]